MAQDDNGAGALVDRFYAALLAKGYRPELHRFEVFGRAERSLCSAVETVTIAPAEKPIMTIVSGLTPYSAARRQIILTAAAPSATPNS